MSSPSVPSATDSRRATARHLSLLFAALYFIQGIGEPTEGLIAQPVRGLLSKWGYDVAELTFFAAVLALPWSLKPLFGLCSDFVPLGGARRRSYLLITSAVAAAGLLYLFFFPPPPGAITWLLCLLLIPTICVAFGDVVVDALMVERGQPLGITGQLQAVQWGAIYTATICVGVVGGWLTQRDHSDWGFLICSLASLVALVVVYCAVPETRKIAAESAQRSGWRGAVHHLGQAAGTPAVQSTLCFLVLWNFNPFSNAMLYVYLTRELGFSDQFYGNLTSLDAVGAIAATLAYGAYCRRVPLAWLVHLSIVAGILATVFYAVLRGPTSAVAITILVGFVYMTGTLVQLDLAARTCPLASAATVFALLMAASNFSTSLATALGGQIYDFLRPEWGPRHAFLALVGLGALTTSLCWLLAPWILRHARQQAHPGP